MNIELMDKIEYFMTYAVAYMLLFIAIASAYGISIWFKKWSVGKMSNAVSSMINITFLFVVIVFGYPAATNIINYILEIVVM